MVFGLEMVEALGRLIVTEFWSVKDAVSATVAIDVGGFWSVFIDALDAAAAAAATALIRI